MTQNLVQRFAPLGIVAGAQLGAADSDRVATHRAADVPERLDRAPPCQPLVVCDVAYPVGDADWPQRLEEIGFLPGERVMVMARGRPGGDPLAVRVGHSTFALRRAEAACVLVRLVPTTG